MSDKIDQRVMVIVNAFKQSVQTSVSPGLSVNTHPNAFFLHVNGEIDFLKAAELALHRLDQYQVALDAQRAKEMASAEEPLVAG